MNRIIFVRLYPLLQKYDMRTVVSVLRKKENPQRCIIVE